jgi:hypothetical protein
MLLPQRENGLIHWIGLQFIRGQLGRRKQQEQLESDHRRKLSPRKNVTARHIRKDGMVIPVKLFGINSLKVGAM